jgi:hypothetical protein
MIKEEVILHKLSITKQKEMQNFQINLPGDAKRIIGMELGIVRKQTFTTVSGWLLSLDRYSNTQGITIDPLFEVRRTKVIGDLSLQTLNNANVFFFQEIKEADPNLFWGSVWEIDTSIREWQAGGKRTEMEVDVVPSTILEGCYRDRWGVIYNLTIHYDVGIYLWIEKHVK